MPNQRKKIILNEILFWKQNKLLPEHYCDFLMTLYLEGDSIEGEISYKKSIKVQEKKSKLLKSVLMMVIAFGLFATLFMSSEALLAPIVILTAVVTFVFVISAFVYARKKESVTPILLISAALLIFGLSVKCATAYFPDNPIVLVVLLICNCILWLMTGLKYKLIYFTISGVLGLLVIMGFQIVY